MYCSLGRKFLVGLVFSSVYNRQLALARHKCSPKAAQKVSADQQRLLVCCIAKNLNCYSGAALWLRLTVCSLARERLKCVEVEYSNLIP